MSNCPGKDGPFHFWLCDGPFDVICDSCGAEGRIEVIRDERQEF